MALSSTVTMFFAAAALVWSCETLPRGRSVERTFSQRTCFVVDAGPGEVVQVSVSQPVDLALQTSGVQSDAFDFGTETLTLTSAGRYSIEVRRVDHSAEAIRISIEQRVLPLTDALVWRDAERQATSSKETMQPDAIEDSLRRWEKLDAQSGIARTYIAKGSAALHSGGLAAARDAYEKARRICNELHDLRCRAEAANNSGLAERRLGDMEAARRRLEEAGADWEQLSLSQEAGMTLSNLGLLLWQTGDLQGAISSYDRARTLLHRRNPLAFARVLNNLGLCYLSLAEYRTALAYFRSALTAFVQRKAASDEARARLNVGRTYMLMGSFRTAQLHLERAAAQAAVLRERSTRADALNNLGQTLLKRSEDAKERFLEALSTYRATGDVRGQASALHYLGIIAFRAGDYDTGRKDLQKALKIRRETELRQDAAASLLALAELERDALRPEIARNYAEESLALVESVRVQVPGPALRAAYYAGMRRVFDVLIDILMELHGPNQVEAGWQTVERGRARALLDAITEPVRMRNAPKDLLSRRSELQQKLNWISARLAGSVTESDRTALRGQTQLLLAEEHEIDAAIRTATGTGTLQEQLPSLQQLRAALPPNSAVLEYHLGSRRSFLWLIDREQMRAFPLAPAAEIQAQAARLTSLFGAILERRRSAEKQHAFSRAMQRLSATLLGTLKGIRVPERILLVPDGVLHSVPFSALQLPGSKRPLGLESELVQIPAAAYLISGKRPRSASAFPEAVLAVADPVFSADDPRVKRPLQHPVPAGTDLARLPFSAELDTISRLVPASRLTILRGFDATPEALARAAARRYAVLHFSTHALIDHEIPAMSRIALSLVDASGRPVDGFLRPYDLSRWRLDGSVVVLSACDTASGKQVLGEGIIGLASSLLYAGASQLVTSLTAIDAEASSAFLSEVYSHMLGARPVSTERAVALARRKLATSTRWADPYYWASFVVTGRPEQ